MSANWKTWCRLCGSPNSAFAIEYFPEIDKIIKDCLRLSISEEKMCSECLNYLNGISNFLIKTKITDKMFQEFIQFRDCEYVQFKKINEIRSKFGLKEIIFDATSDDCKALIEEDIIGNDMEPEDQEIEGIHNLQSLNMSEQEEQFGETVKMESPQQFLLKNEDLLPVNENLTENDVEEQDWEDKRGSDEVEVIEIQLQNAQFSNESEIIGIDVEDLEESGEYFRDYDEPNDHEYLEIEDENDLDEDNFLVTNYTSDSSIISKDNLTKTEDEKYFDFICHICNVEFAKMSALSSHCRVSHRCLPQVKCFCGKMLGTWKRLLIHKKKHFDEKSEFECTECHISYQKRSTYEAHMLSKHGPNKAVFECNICNKKFKENKILKNHLKTHLPDDLKRTVSCKICDKRFVNRHCLDKHTNSFHTREFIVSCEICGRNFTSKGNLSSHMLTHKTEKNLECNQCGMKFKSNSALRMHKKTHEGKTLECNLCEAKFSIKSCLVNHMLVHSDEKKYKCEFCPNEYKRPQALKCHLSVHTGERPYVCQFCDRTFVNNSNCRKHKLKDHPQELEEWERIHGRAKPGPPEPAEIKGRQPHVNTSILIQK